MNSQARHYADEVRRRSLADVSTSESAAPLQSRALTLLTPRVVVGLLWLFSYWFDGLFVSLLWPVVGLVFLPVTLLWYSVVYHWFAGAWTLGPIVGLVGAFVIDLTIIRAQHWFTSRQPDGS